MIGNTFVIDGTFKSSLICQDVDDLVPRKSKAKEEAADNGENVKLLSEFSDTRARYILKWWLLYCILFSWFPHLNAMSLLTFTKFFVPSSSPLLVTLRPRLPGGASGRLSVFAANEAKCSAVW